jgi:hypothetical protein
MPNLREMSLSPEERKALSATRMLKCIAVLGSIMSVVLVFTIFDYRSNDTVILSSEPNTEAQLQSVKQKLNTWTARLNHLAGEFSDIRREQSSLKNSEERLEAKEATIRSAVHAARDSVMALRYKIHDMESDALSNAMFGSSAQKKRTSATVTASRVSASHVAAARPAPQTVAPVKPPVSPLVHSASTHSLLRPQPVAVPKVHPSSPKAAISEPTIHALPAAARIANKATTEAQRQAAIAALEAKARRALLHTAAIATASKHALTRSLSASQSPVKAASHRSPIRTAASRAIVARREAAARSAVPRSLQQIQLAPASSRDMQRLSTDEQALLAQRRAVQAQNQAFRRSDSFLHLQAAARLAQQRSPYGPDFPVLPVLRPLSPEASG